MSERDLYAGTQDAPLFPSIGQNLRALPSKISLGAAVSGFLVVLVGVTGPVVIMLQAAQAGHFTSAETATWLFSAWIGSGIFCLYLSLRCGIPVIGATSTASIVLLVTSFQSHSIAQAIGSYYIVGALSILIGVTGLMERIMKVIPHEIVMAMLAGVLFQFGTSIFAKFHEQPWIVGTMIATYFIARRLALRAPVVSVMAVGFAIAALTHNLNFKSAHFGVVHPLWVNPEWSFESAINLALPMLLLTIATQYAPGVAVIKSGGFKSPTNKELVVGGVISLATAGFYNSGINTSAITAGIAVGEISEPDRTRRYTAGVVCGISYIIAGLLGAAVVTFFSALPAAMLAALAGLGLFPAIANSLHESLKLPQPREAALATLLITMSGVHPLHLGSPFWGLIAGICLHAFVLFKKKS